MGLASLGPPYKLRATRSKVAEFPRNCYTLCRFFTLTITGRLLILARNFRYFEKKRGHRRTGSRFVGSAGEAAFFGPSCSSSGAVGISVGIARLIVPEWRVNHGFVEHACKIVERRVEPAPGEKGTLYRPEIKIEYEVQGVIYSPYTFDIHHTSFAKPEEAQAAIDRFADRASGTCWYDPDDPGSAVLVRGYQWWIWPALLVPVSFIAIGVGGLIYTMLNWGKSAERRAAARKLPAAELFDRPAKADPQFPFVPDCSEITSSPGTRLAYRLPLAQSPGWAIFGLLAAAIAWNGTVSVFVIMAAASMFRGKTDWLMTLFTLPFLGIGAALVVVFVKQLRHSGGCRPDARGDQRSSAHAGAQLPLVPVADGQPETQVGRYLPDVRRGGGVQPRHERPH